MQTETVFKVAFGVWAVLFIMPVARANRKAKLEHGCDEATKRRSDEATECDRIRATKSDARMSLKGGKELRSSARGNRHS